MAERLAEPSRPRACSVAIFAQVPVPHGERSIAPVHVAGRSQSSCPVETITALRRSVVARRGGPESCAIVTSWIAGFSGWTTGSCSCAAALIISPMRAMSRPSSGVSRSPNARGIGDDVEHAAVRDVDAARAERRDLDRRVEVHGERRHVPERRPA